MTLKNLLSVAAVAALMTSSAMAQGPVYTVDLIRAGAGNTGLPVLGPNGGLQYGVFVAPDNSIGTFTGAAAGPNGAGGSLGLEFGVTVSSGLFNDTPDAVFSDLQSDLLTIENASVTINTTDGADAGTPGDSSGVAANNGLIDFGNPGNQIFAFETNVFDGPDADPAADFPGGVQIGQNIAGGADPLDAIFAALGTTFITAAEANVGGASPAFEVLRFETTALAVGNLTHTVALSGVGDLFTGAAGSAIAAQTIDLTTTPPQSQQFFPAGVSVTDTILAGDANLDGTVDFSDFSLLSGNFFGTGDFSAGNFNGDSVVDFSDFSILSGNFFASGVAPVVSPTPEPTSLALLFSAVLVAGSRKKRD